MCRPLLYILFAISTASLGNAQDLHLQSGRFNRCEGELLDPGGSQSYSAGKTWSPRYVQQPRVRAWPFDLPGQIFAGATVFASMTVSTSPIQSLLAAPAGRVLE